MLLLGTDGGPGRRIFAGVEVADDEVDGIGIGRLWR